MIDSNWAGLLVFFGLICGLCVGWAWGFIQGTRVRRAEGEKFMAALEAQLEAHNYAEVLEIARKALANDECPIG